MADGIRIDVGVTSDTRDLRNLGETLDDVARSGDTMGQQIEDALGEAERAARPTNSEYKRLASDLERYARQSGQSMSDAFQDFERHASDAGLEVSDGVMDALRRLGDRTPSEVEKVSDAFREMGRAARDSGDEAADSVDLEGPLTATQDMVNEVRQSLGESMGELAGTFAENGFNMEDTIDGVVEVAAEAAQALPGPFGLAGGAIVTIAAGIYGEFQKRFEQIAADASAMYQDMLESGADFLSNDFYQKKLGEFFDPMGESYDANMKKLNVLEDLGVPVDEASRALVGYGDNADEVLGLAKDRMEEYRGSVSILDDDFGALASGAVQNLGDVITTIEDSKTSTDTAKRAVDNYRDSIEEIPGNKKTDVDVDDNGSTQRTQSKIDGIHGKRVAVDVIANTYSAEADLARLSQTYNGKTLHMNVEMRRTGGFYK